MCSDLYSVTAQKIQAGLTTEFIGRQIHCYDTIDSTNNMAKREHTRSDGTVFIAQAQTGGRGRHGNTWISPAGDGIWMSVLLKPDIPLSQVAQITPVAGLAVCRGINRLFSETVDAKIKWPNDIVANGKKICGILTELAADTDAGHYVVAGIGINVNTHGFDGDLSQKATSLFLETGKKQDRIPLIQAVLAEFEALYTAFCAHGFSAIADEYKKHCITLGKDVLVLSGTKSYTAKAVDVDAWGQLIVEKDGENITVNAGEVSVRGIYGYI